MGRPEKKRVPKRESLVVLLARLKCSDSASVRLLAFAAVCFLAAEDRTHKAKVRHVLKVIVISTGNSF